jgi:signal transduction histidine kinase
MRRRLMIAIMGTALAVVVAFGAPLALVAGRLVREESDRRLQKEADAVALTVEGQGDRLDPSAPSTLAPAATPLVGRGDRVLLVLPGGQTSRGTGPAARLHDPLVAEAMTDRGIVARVESPAGPTDARVRRAWMLIAAVGAGALALSLALATVLSRRLSRPLHDLADVSTRLGAGDFRARAQQSGVPEMDTVAERLNNSTEQLALMLEREHDFAENASHQLRTALTALRIPLEELTAADNPSQIRELTDLVVHQTDRLQAAIESLLDLAHGHARPATSYEVDEVVSERAAAWAPVLARHGRRLVTDGSLAGNGGHVTADGSAATLRQVLDVLIDNADRHGHGDVRLSVHSQSGSEIVRVIDDGPGIVDGFEQRIFERGTSLGNGHGIGLAVARDLLVKEDGQLVLARSQPPTFEVFLAGRSSPAATVTEA